MLVVSPCFAAVCVCRCGRVFVPAQERSLSDFTLCRTSRVSASPFGVGVRLVLLFMQVRFQVADAGMYASVRGQTLAFQALSRHHCAPAALGRAALLCRHQLGDSNYEVAHQHTVELFLRRSRYTMAGGRRVRTLVEVGAARSAAHALVGLAIRVDLRPRSHRTVCSCSDILLICP